MMLKLSILAFAYVSCHVECQYAIRRPAAIVKSQFYSGTEGSQPSHQGAQPSHQGAQPSHQGAQPSHQGAQPSHQGAQPSHQGAQPSHQGAAAPSMGQQIPAWFFPECPGGRVSRRRDGTLHCCQRTTNDICRNIRKQFTLFDEDPVKECSGGTIIGCSEMNLCCRGTGPNMTCGPIRKQEDEPRQAPVLPSTTQTPTQTTVAPSTQCPGGRVMDCGPMRFCCTGSGSSETCKPINK